jgi:hypothetical protein
MHPDPEVVALSRAIGARIDGLGPHETDSKDGFIIHLRSGIPFLQIQINRDHMNLDLWLGGTVLADARSSGIARSHPFLGDEAVKIRFERAQDLSRVARWIEASFDYAKERARRAAEVAERRARGEPDPVPEAPPPPPAPVNGGASQLANTPASQPAKEEASVPSGDPVLVRANGAAKVKKAPAAKPAKAAAAAPSPKKQPAPGAKAKAKAGAKPLAKKAPSKKAAAGARSSAKKSTGRTSRPSRRS